MKKKVGFIFNLSLRAKKENLLNANKNLSEVPSIGSPSIGSPSITVYKQVSKPPKPDQI